MFQGASAATSMMVLQKGERAKFSNAQICLLVIDMYSAKKNLEKSQYKEMKKIYQVVLKETEKQMMDYDDFVERAAEIVKRFEVVAPYEKFCGDEPDSYGPVMSRLRRG